jgi:hypothetical protein
MLCLGASTALASDSMSTPTPLPFDTPLVVDTTAYTVDAGEPNTAPPFTEACGRTGGATTGVARTAWFTIDGDGGQVTVTTAGSNPLDTSMFVYAGSASGAFVTCNDDAPGTTTSSVTFQTVAGQTYAIQAGTFCADVSCPVASGGSLHIEASTTAPPVPANFVAPTVAGSAKQGEVLTETHGHWTKNPSAFSYQWQDCDASGANCTSISGATSQTYTITLSDAGHTIRVLETAANSSGPGTPAASAPTEVVTPSRPVIASPPRITGPLTQGKTLTEAHGSWSNAPVSYSYVWERCDAGGKHCAPIARATNQYYVLTAADVGHRILVLESAANAGGPASAFPSGPTRGVIAPSPAALRKLLGALIAPHGDGGRIPALLKNGGYAEPVDLPVPGTLTISWTAGPASIGSGKLTVRQAGKGLFKVKLTGKGKTELKHAHSLALTGKGSFTPAGHDTTSTTKTFTLRG